MNLKFGLTLIIVIGVNTFLCMRLPYFLAPIAPLGYLLTVCLILLWILHASKRDDVPTRHSRRPTPSSSSSSPHQHLQAADILQWEFEYARTTASEAMNDRQTLVNFYLAIVGALLTAVAILIIEGPELQELSAYHAIGAVVLWALVIVGWIFFLQMVQLRRAWYRSARSMNRIKDFYLEHAQDFNREELGEAFLWKTESLPRPDKKWNIFFFSMTLIAFLNSLSFTFGALLLDLPVYDIAPNALRSDVYWIILIVSGLSMFSLHIFMYTAFLKEPVPKGEITVMPEDQKSPTTSNRRVEVLEKHRDYDGLYKIDKVRLRFERFDGTLSEPVTRLVFERGDSVCVLPYDRSKDAVLLIQQFRYPAYVRNGPGWLWEIVAGVQDTGRDRVAVAHAELLEEAGYQVETLVPIMHFYLSPGGSSERTYLYLGYITSENHVSPGGGLASENEDIAVSLVPFQEAMSMIRSGAIMEAKTLIALQWLALHKKDLPRVPFK